MLSAVVNVLDVLCSLPDAECIVWTFWQEEDRFGGSYIE